MRFPASAFGQSDDPNHTSRPSESQRSGLAGWFSAGGAVPIGHPPPFPDTTTQAYEKALALDAVPNL
jgi:hypothetical protein